MRIRFLILLIFFYPQTVTSEAKVLPDQVSSILENGVNKSFIQRLNDEFRHLISEKVDSILLFYPVDIYYLGKPFAIIVWKKANQSQCLVIFQSGVSSGAVNKEISKNDSLKNVTIKEFF